jgi:hypothetical protein
MRALMLSLALAAAFLASNAAGQTLKGRWSGLVDQTGPGALTDRYVATLSLDGAAGAMDYPTLGCVGDVTFVGKSGEVSTYRESITHGPCIDGGTISVQPAKGGLVWSWSAAGVTARGRFYRVADKSTPH